MKNTVVRMPGPSWMLNRWMSKMRPLTPARVLVLMQAPWLGERRGDVDRPSVYAMGMGGVYAEEAQGEEVALWVG